MSSGGHTQDMINRFKQNREAMVARRDKMRKLQDRYQLNIKEQIQAKIFDQNVSKEEAIKIRNEIRTKLKKEIRISMIKSITVALILFSIFLYFILNLFQVI